MTQLLTNIAKKERILTALKEAISINRGPVGYGDVARRIRDIEPQSVERYLRDMALNDLRVIRLGPGLYVTKDRERINSLGGFW